MKPNYEYLKEARDMQCGSSMDPIVKKKVLDGPNNVILDSNLDV